MAQFSIMEEDLLSMDFLRAILGEIVGTFFLIFLGCGGVNGMGANVDFVHVAFAFGIGESSSSLFSKHRKHLLTAFQVS